MGLKDYLAKRRFNRTPEPRGGTAKGKGLIFVVQKHHASQLHYDFRLELDGVLKSWAIPKGPSTDPHDHRLAMQVEDHPYDYRTFEGVIPQGNYGAGNVIVWDQGTYEPRLASADPQATLRAGLKKGHLTFILHGSKLRGEFALIRMPKAGEHAWLLIKKGDEFANTDDVTANEASVVSGLDVDAVAGAVPDPTAYPKHARPPHISPMLCSLAGEPFDKDGWLFEIKWDGYRAIGSSYKSEVSLYSRTGLDFTPRYPALAEALHAFGDNVVVDGEIVVVDDQGDPHFEWLQGWTKTGGGELRYYVFDLVWLNGRDLTGMPLRERKQLLHSILPDHPHLHFSDDVAHDGKKLFAAARRRGIEGIVAKRADSPYRTGERSADWVKLKTGARQEVVIGGYTEPRGSRTHLGSLLVGVYRDGQLWYVGHSGGGIAEEARASLHAQLQKIEQATYPFAQEPEPNAPVHWVQPLLVCEMEFTEWTADGRMRHPKFIGLRPDKPPREVIRETPGPAAITKPTALSAKQKSDSVAFTHLEKVFFPKKGYTKGDLVDYYTAVAPFILPCLQGRPLSLLRQPDGIGGMAFFQKNMEHLPDWAPYTDIFSESNGHDLRWIVGDSLEVLHYIVQLGSIEVNPWNSRVGHLQSPDWSVIDLDPEGVSFAKVITVAQTVKAVCDEWGVACYPKTSGKTGLHIYIPLAAAYSYEQAKNFAHLLALEVNRRQPKLTSLERSPEKRHNKIYLDYLQNRAGQTLAAPYSVRPVADACVSAPLRWDEVKTGLKPEQFTLATMPGRLRKVGDLWKPVIGKGIDLAAVLARIEAGTTHKK